MFKILSEQHGKRFIKGCLWPVVSDNDHFMIKINKLRFPLCSNDNTDVRRYAFFGIKNKDIQFTGSAFLNDGMIYRKIIRNKGYRFIPLDPSWKVFSIAIIF